jgi:hypothetical protein
VKPSRDPHFNSGVILAGVFPRGQFLLELSIYQGHRDIKQLGTRTRCFCDVEGKYMKNLARSKVRSKAFFSHEEGLQGRLFRRIQRSSRQDAAFDFHRCRELTYGSTLSRKPIITAAYCSGCNRAAAP